MAAAELLASCVFFSFDDGKVEIKALAHENDDYLSFLALEGERLAQKLAKDISISKPTNSKTGPVYGIRFWYDENDGVIVEPSAMLRCSKAAHKVEVGILSSLADKVVKSVSRLFIKERVYPSYLRPVG